MNSSHMSLLAQGAEDWNEWRRAAVDAVPDLVGADLKSKDLGGMNFNGANLEGANLAGTNLAGVTAQGARLSHALIVDANLVGADLSRANLFGANLTRARLNGASLRGADVSEADLSRAVLVDARLVRAILTDANLSGADLSRSNLHSASALSANLSGASLVASDLSWADLTRANLKSADLTSATLSGTKVVAASLLGTTLSGARLSETVFSDVSLDSCIGLESCVHRGPSVVDFRTISRSGRALSEHFLRGCGFPDALIHYLPSLLSPSAIQFYSCFISYSTADEEFAVRLHADLQARGVRCWFAPHDMRPGRLIHEQIDDAIRVYDRLLLILSSESMSSPWVKTEIAKARQKARELKRHVLFPVSLVPFADVRAWEQFDSDMGDDSAKAIREFYIPDFADWKRNHDEYQRQFVRLVEALKSTD